MNNPTADEQQEVKGRAKLVRALVEMVFKLSGANPDEVISDGESTWPLHGEVEARIRELLAASPVGEQDAVALNARRYEWLRDRNLKLEDLWQVINDDCNPPYKDFKWGEKLDAAIDAAIHERESK